MSSDGLASRSFNYYISSPRSYNIEMSHFSSTLTPEEARNLIEHIAEDHGWFTRELREQTPEKVLRAVEKLRSGYGAAARLLAQNLYRSQARFVFELIQNAEDNRYSRALASNAKPYIKFRISPDKIVVDSNEDGFTAANVKAICQVGGSTKTRTDAAQYYIGEKGIGFKSVFMVASRVYIQSGPFSFFFEHEEGDTGIGMIAPEYEKPKETLEDPLTRMTLSLIKGIDETALHQQFRDLPDTLLLFLRQLGSISIERSGFTDGVSESTTYTCQHDEEAGRTILEKTYRKGSEPPEKSLRYYFVQRKLLQDLPNDPKRDYNTAEVVLAFPFDDNSEPVIENQEVFAYLPIRDFGFPFVIQSDFVTQASRQDVMETTRNLTILREIAVTFADAVLKMCTHNTLQFQWMRYLPKKESVTEGFGGNLFLISY